jgi:hypothetical protein
MRSTTMKAENIRGGQIVRLYPDWMPVEVIRLFPADDDEHRVGWVIRALGPNAKRTWVQPFRDLEVQVVR